MIRIALSGTHCTGKTTLIEAIKSEPFFDSTSWRILPGPTRFLKDKGYPINNNESDNYDQTQLGCLWNDLENLQSPLISRSIISDRCLIDTYIYTKYLYNKGKVSEFVMKVIEKSWQRSAKDYDIIFLPSPGDIELVGDRYRSEDHEFRDSVWTLFLAEINNNSKQFVALTGTVENRIQTLKNKINQYVCHQ